MWLARYVLGGFYGGLQQARWPVGLAALAGLAVAFFQKQTGWLMRA